MAENTFRKNAVSLIMGVLFFLCIGSVSISSGYEPADVANKVSAEITGQDNRAKILSVIETRSSTKEVVNKAAEKLRTMKGRELQLMSFLCDRIAADKNTLSADIAFSLLTALLILS